MSTSAARPTMSERDPRARVDEAAVARGGSWLLLSSVVGIVGSIVTTPLLVRRFGVERFGIFALLLSVATYLGVGDAGMGATSTRYGADAYQRGDLAEEAGAIWNAALLAAIPSGLLGIVTFICAPQILRYLNVPAELDGEAVFALRLVAVSVTARNIAGVFNTPQVVRMRYHLVGGIAIATTVLQSVGLLAIAICGAGLVGAGGAIALASFFLLGAQFYYGRRCAPQLLPPRLAGALLWPMLRYTGSILVAIFVSLILQQVDRAVISQYVSVSAVGYYALAATLASAAGMIPRAVKSALFSAASRLSSTESSRLTTLYVRTFRVTAAIMLPICATMTAFGPAVLRIWAGPAFAAHGATAFALLTWAMMLSGLAQLSAGTLYGQGRASAVARAAIIVNVPYACAVVYIVHRWGVDGAAVAALVRAMLEFTSLAVMTREDLRDAIRPSERPYVAFALVIVVTLVVIVSTRTSAGLFCGLGGALALGAMVRPFLRSDERALVLAAWNRILRVAIRSRRPLA